MNSKHDGGKAAVNHPGTTKLSQAALILLGQAAERPDGMLLPPPAALRTRGSALQKVLHALLKAALVGEMPVAEPAQGWRQDERGRHFALAITAEGYRAIGLPIPAPAPELRPKPASKPKAAKTVAPTADGPAAGQAEVPDDAAPASPEPTRATKQARLVSLLSAEGGRSVPALAAALSWQNHTVRAALTGLRQKGHDLLKLKDAEGATVYRIAHAADTASGPAARGA